MKNLATFLFILGFSLPGFSQDERSSIEIQVDGKTFATISKENISNYTVSIPLAKGRHEIRWVANQEIPRPGPNAEAAINETLSATGPVVAVETARPARMDVVNKIIELTPEEKDSIRIDIYDNGVVDNDTISVYGDEETLVDRQKVSSRPISVYTSMTQGQLTKRIRMQAENLGLIPPNTTLMIVTTKKNKYTVNMTSDMRKNAVIDFIVNKEQPAYPIPLK
jgi:hypothetical protein